MSESRSTPRLRLTAGVLAAVLALVAVSARGWATGLPGELMQLAGLVLVTCAALGRIWTSLYIAGFKDAWLVRHGPYASLRHPLYALSWLGMLGVGLATRSLALTTALTVLFAVVYRAAGRAEDEFLAKAHGAAFEQYRRDVASWLPRPSAYVVPASLEVRPPVLWKAFLDAGSLLGLYALLRLADALQRAGVTPTLLDLP